MIDIFDEFVILSGTQAAVVLSLLALNPGNSIEEFKKTYPPG
jgi:hypothetical protein